MVAAQRPRYRARCPVRALSLGAALGAVCIAARSANRVMRHSKAFLLPCGPEQQSAAAATGLAVMLLAGQPHAALAEAPGVMADLEAKLNMRKQGLITKQVEKSEVGLYDKVLDKFVQKEVESARQNQETRLRQAQIEERKAKEQATKKEAEELSTIETEAKLTKELISRETMEATKKAEEADKKGIEAIKAAERQEKKAAQDAEKRERAVAKNEEERLAAEARKEAAFDAASEKAEAAIIATKDRSAQALKETLLKATERQIQTSKLAEQQAKEAAQRAARARSAAAEKAVSTELQAVQEAAQVERNLVQTFEQIKDKELKEDSEGLQQVKAVSSTVVSVVTSTLGPGLVLAIYAVIASVVSPRPEPCKGGETDETRRRMGRLARPEKKPAAQDYGEDLQGKEKKKPLTVEEVFDALDVNKDGVLSAAEFKEGISRSKRERRTT